MGACRRRGVALVVVCVALVAACGGSDPTASASGSSSSDPSVLSVVSDGAAAATTDASSSSPTTGRSTTPRPPATGGSGDTSASSAPATAPAPDPGDVGTFAAFYLRARESASIELAIASQSGAAPQAGVVDHLVGVLRAVSGKPVRVAPRALGGGSTHWSTPDITRAVDQSSPAQSREAAVVTLLFVHGDYSGDTSILGASVRADATAIFVDQEASAAGLLGNIVDIERAVTTHELGHLLGLVDLFLHTGRQDPSHPGHSRNKGSVMYWAVESDVIGQLLGAKPPTEFDQADLADLATIRSG
jgi:hypothetical protein